jgi:hypothetical protein
MNAPRVYEIRIEGLVSEKWSGWFEGLTIQQAFGEETILRGLLADQAALLGILAKIHSLNLKIIAVTRVSAITKLDANNQN